MCLAQGSTRAHGPLPPPPHIPFLVPARAHNAVTWILEVGGRGMSKCSGRAVYWKPASPRMPRGDMWQPGQTGHSQVATSPASDQLSQPSAGRNAGGIRG